MSIETANARNKAPEINAGGGPAEAAVGDPSREPMTIDMVQPAGGGTDSEMGGSTAEAAVQTSQVSVQRIVLEI